MNAAPAALGSSWLYLGLGPFQFSVLSGVAMVVPGSTRPANDVAVGLIVPAAIGAQPTVLPVGQEYWAKGLALGTEIQQIAASGQSSGNGSSPGGDIASAGSTPLSTNSGLTPLPVAIAVLPLPAGAATDASVQAIKTALQGALSVSGSVDVANFPSGGATEAGLEALNATLGSLLKSGQAVTANLGTLNGAATEGTLAGLKAAVQAQIDLASTLWTDNSGAFYVRRDLVNEATGTISVAFTDPLGVAVTPGAGLKPAATANGGGGGAANTRTVLQAIFDATAAGTGIAVGDVLGRVTMLDTSTAPPTVVVATWLNLTAGTVLGAAPAAGSIVEQTQHVTVAASALPAGAATETTQLALLDAAKAPLTAGSKVGIDGSGYLASGVDAVSGTFTGTGQSAAFAPLAGRGFNIVLSGTFGGASVQLECSFDQGVTWHPLTAAGGSIFVFTGPCCEKWQEDEVGVLFRLDCTVAPASGDTITLRMSQ